MAVILITREGSSQLFWTSRLGLTLQSDYRRKSRVLLVLSPGWSNRLAQRCNLLSQAAHRSRQRLRGMLHEHFLGNCDQLQVTLFSSTDQHIPEQNSFRFVHTKM